MIRFLSGFFVLSLLAALPCGALPASGNGIAPVEKVIVYILAGQSNAVGYNHIREYHGDSADLSRRLRGLSDILFWPGTNALPGSAGKWTRLRPGLSSIASEESYRNGCFGPEIGFALKLRELNPDGKIAIIKFAEGGTGIARSSDYHDYIPALKGFDDQGNNWAPPAGGQSAGKLYTGLITNVKTALSALDSLGKDYEPGGFIWMQGEHEAGISPTMADDYDKILSAFIRAVRKDLRQPNLPVLIGEINSHTWAFGDRARTRQAAVCFEDPLSILVKTVDLPRKGVGNLAHFDADGMLELGKRFGIAAGRFLAKTPDAEDGGAITFGSLLAEMTDRTIVAQIPGKKYKLLQASSYDRRAVEKDKEGWYANDDWSNYLRKEVANGQEVFVLLDTTGPGAITRFWTGGHPNRPNHLKFYIDGQETPFWEADHTGALIGQNADFGAPLSQRSVDMDSLNINRGAQPGHNLYAPIPFSRRIRITSDVPKGGADTGFWYNINYRLYEEPVPVESFTSEMPVGCYEALQQANRQLADFMSVPAAETRVSGESRVKETAFALGRDARSEIRLSGKASVRRIFIRLDKDNRDLAIRDTWLLVAFDGNQTVEVPLGFLFGCGDQLVPAGDWYRKIDADGNMACFWVMPFLKEARITLVNHGTIPVSGSMEVATGDWSWDDRSLYFHSAFRRLTMPGKTTLDFNFADLAGEPGMYVGDILQAHKEFRGWWGEGDEKIYIDGSTFPDHFGTGSEDYYGYAWGHPETFSNIFNGQPIGNGNTGERGTTVNSRVRSLDAIPFRRSLKVDMESWQLYGGPVDYALASFWYQKR